MTNVTMKMPEAQLSYQDRSTGKQKLTLISIAGEEPKNKIGGDQNANRTGSDIGKCSGNKI